MTVQAGTGFEHDLHQMHWSRQEMEFWDPNRWQLSTLLRRCRQWVGATRARRRAMWILLSLFVLVVFPGLLGAVATAQSGTGASSVNSALSWMEIRDSSGVQLSEYLFATDHGSLLDPGDTAISLVISLEFAGWMVIVTTAIWLIGYAFSFRWLDMFGSALVGMADSLTGQIATPMLLVTSAAIGAFFVAWFIVRGFPAKAVAQVVTMLIVAIVGPLFLAEPLADVLSSHGLLVQGRDVGISVAAGLNGNGHPNPTQLVAAMQGDLADNFARRPLQVWNFGHIVDERPACQAAWSAGVAAGDDDRVKNGMKVCGDAAAHAAAESPSVGQIGAGLLLLLSGTVLLAFAVFLSIKVIWAALDTIYHGLMSIFGFAAGGFVYGPTQTFLVRNIVDGFVAAARMALYTIFLGVYVLFLGNLFHQARGQVMAVFVIGAIVEIVAILQLRRLARSLDGGNEWMANRVALAIQGSAGRGSGSAGGGTALGMGAVGTGHKMSGIGMMALFGGLSTIANSPLTEWAMAGIPGSFHPQSRLKKKMTEAQAGFWNEAGMGGPKGAYSMSYMNRMLFARGARDSALKHGGLDSVLGSAAGVQGVIDVGGGIPDSFGAMVGAGIDETRAFYAARSRGIVAQHAEDETLADKDLSLVVAATKRAQDSANKLLAGTGDVNEAAADFATLQQASFIFRRAKSGGVTLDGGRNRPGLPLGPEESYVRDYMANPTEEKIDALRRLSNGDSLLEVDPVTGVLAPINVSAHRLLNDRIDQRAATRMRLWIGNEHAREIKDAVDTLITDVTDPQAIREVRRVVAAADDTDHWAAGVMGTPWNSVTPPGANPHNPRWGAAMAPLQDRLRR